jgi:hypothetical protein
MKQRGQDGQEGRQARIATQTHAHRLGWCRERRGQIIKKARGHRVSGADIRILWGRLIDATMRQYGCKEIPWHFAIS